VDGTGTSSARTGRFEILNRSGGLRQWTGRIAPSHNSLQTPRAGSTVPDERLTRTPSPTEPDHEATRFLENHRSRRASPTGPHSRRRRQGRLQEGHRGQRRAQVRVRPPLGRVARLAQVADNAQRRPRRRRFVYITHRESARM
jgi:hypothetical protein